MTQYARIPIPDNGSGGGSGATTPKIYNFSVVAANTEYSITLSAGVKQVQIRVRGTARMQFCFVSGESGTNFFTIPGGCTETIEGLNFSGTLYFQLNKPTQVVEILEWV